ncbi:AI-2E family transporter [Pseudalkalibacillus salsuginis]|uniref:AI-2E family transporter n=1 Tax=Pseudalkalibacillus salsuginis TaxID=2910972 RepID=UPI001F286B7A|nr:AI-2E family transporter [Pseudalkalibacillus salsuginis]MCF6408578.1 AI-2E family transporter [Pseudalkalibacillus salsuginis]
MLQSKLFRALIWVLLLFIIVWIGTEISFLFKPIGILITTLFFPIVVSGVFFYLFRPVVKWIQKLKLPKVLAILIVYLLFAGIVTGISLSVGPILQEQVKGLVNGAPELAEDFKKTMEEWKENPAVSRLLSSEMMKEGNLPERLSGSIGNISSTVSSYIISFLSILTNIIIVLILLPFILFYMLKDGDRLPDSILRFLPVKHRDEGMTILRDMDEALSGFIQGQLIVSLFIGTFVYIWYLIIGLDYALILALIALVLNVVPFVGPIIGTAPGVIVGLIHSPMTALYVILGVIVIQQIESNLVSPQVMGRRLDVHPLTVILLLLVASAIGGVLGLILAIPTYAVGKVIVIHTKRLIKLYGNAS